MSQVTPQTNDERTVRRLHAAADQADSLGHNLRRLVRVRRVNERQLVCAVDLADWLGEEPRRVAIELDKQARWNGDRP